MKRTGKPERARSRGRGGLLLVVLIVGTVLAPSWSPIATGAVLPRSAALESGRALPPGLARLAATASAPGAPLDGIATFGGRRPTAAEDRVLSDLGLQVQVLSHLPLALVRGTLPQLRAAVRRGVATDVYPNEPVRYASATSTRSIGADGLRAQGVTGRGIGVAIVDSGIDGTHPDLADHVTHNVKIVASNTVRRRAGVAAIAVPVDQGPYNNSDLTSGHGTHVAGIVAADGHTSPDQVGVAPDANLIGYGAGEYNTMIAQLVAYDDILEHQRDWGIRVVNNSWAVSFRLFDPDDPVNISTKRLHDAGLVVVFAAGNDGDEMQLNPHSAAPWVISVAAGTVSKVHSGFSSGGIQFDNTPLSAVPPDRHLRFQGDAIGLYHPDVSAPGTKIVSSATPTGLAVGAAPQCLAVTIPDRPCTKAASGTSMAAPHVAGVAALLLQVRPDLTPDQVGQVLEVTAAPMNDGSAFWQSGYGFVDGAAALALVRRPDFGPDLLIRLRESADARVQASRPFAVSSTEFWSLSALPATTGTLQVPITPETTALKAVAAFPSPARTTSLGDDNPFQYQLILKDASGAVLAESEMSKLAGTITLFVDLRVVPSVTFGTWTLELAGLSASGGEQMDDFVTVTMAQLVLQPAGRR